MSRFLSFILPLLQLAVASNGPAYSTGPVSAGNFIREAYATLIVPNPPNPVVGNTVLWVGMGTSNGDLIQAINNNYPADTLYVPCVASWLRSFSLGNFRRGFHDKMTDAVVSEAWKYEPRSK